MNAIGVFFFLASAVALLALPRKWAPMALILGACYMTYGQGVELGPFRFTVIRLLIFIGFLRVIARREHLFGGIHGMDKLILAWGFWVIVSSAFHKEPGEALTFHLGMFYNELGIYFLIRCLCRSMEDLKQIIAMTAILLVPVALEMLSEQLTHRNLFAVLGGVAAMPSIRRSEER